jgi:acetolactate decarboxylase
MKKAIIYLALFAFSIILNSFNSFANSTQSDTAKYQCPMKCEGEKTYDNPGKCPVCGMSLKKISQPEVYKCPMKCEGEKTYNKPGKCPVCGMSLKKISQPAVTESSAIKKSNVRITGALMNVMRKGELFGTINLDTISNKEHLYGLGPVEYLKGECLIVDGTSYRSTVAADGSIKMEETFKTKAPFFVYTNIDKWKEVLLPDSVQTIPQLESFLDLSTKNHSRPFAFRLTATLESGEIHIVNLPAGTAVHSPEDAHQNQLTDKLKKQSVELVGFFSTEHEGVFTHHDNFVHIHLLTTDRKKMGHVENMMIKKGTARLYIPAE